MEFCPAAYNFLQGGLSPLFTGLLRFDLRRLENWECLTAPGKGKIAPNGMK